VVVPGGEEGRDVGCGNPRTIASLLARSIVPPVAEIDPTTSRLARAEGRLVAASATTPDPVVAAVPNVTVPLAGARVIRPAAALTVAAETMPPENVWLPENAASAEMLIPSATGPA